MKCLTCGADNIQGAEHCWKCNAPAVKRERRYLTFLFCDIVNSGLLSDALGEQCGIVLRKIGSLWRGLVTDYQGMVHDIKGDGMLALFGVPVARENSPRQAIRCAMKLHEAMEGFKDTNLDEANLGVLRVRIGVHSGEAIVAITAEPQPCIQVEQGTDLVIGKRLEEEAIPGLTYVSGDTEKLCERYFSFRFIGEHPLKNVSHPVKIYQLVGNRVIGNRMVRGDLESFRLSTENVTELVGRSSEVESLRQGCLSVRTKGSKIFSIFGEAGVGKTRVLSEMFQDLRRENVTVVSAQCSSGSEHSPYYVIREFIQSSAGVDEKDNSPTILGKINSWLRTLGVDYDAIAKPISQVIFAPEPFLIPIASIEQQTDTIHQAVKAIVLAAAERRPTILVCEDIQWIDASSLELCNNLANSLGEASVALIFTFRPPIKLLWKTNERNTLMEIKRLESIDCETLVRNVFRMQHVRSDLMDYVITRAEGIPFFVEALIGLLKEKNLVDTSGEIAHPRDNLPKEGVVGLDIHDIIMARVDLLPEGSIEVLQAGSAIGRSFHFDLLRQVTGLPEQQLEQLLSGPLQRGILRQVATLSDGVFAFDHTLTRDAVYNSMVEDHRRSLHRIVASVIEQNCQGQILPDTVLQLATHYFASDQPEKGAAYAQQAGNIAERTGALTDAIEYDKKRIICLEKLDASSTHKKQLVDARTDLGIHNLQMRYIHAANEAINPILALAVQCNKTDVFAKIWAIKGIYEYWVEENLLTALESLEIARSEAERHQDIDSLGRVLYWSGYANSFLCKFSEAEKDILHALNISEKMDQVVNQKLWLTSLAKSALGDFVYCRNGRVSLAYVTTQEALEIANQCGDIFSRAMANTAHGVCCTCMRYIDEGMERLLEGLECCYKINLFSCAAVAHFLSGELEFESGNYQASLGHFSDAVRDLQYINVLPSWQDLNRIGMLRAKAYLDPASVNVQAILPLIERCKIPLYRGMMHRLVAEILMNLGGTYLDEAESRIKLAIETDQENEMRWHVARNEMVYADILSRKGSRLLCQNRLTDAQTIFRECGAEGWVQEASKRVEKFCS
ncbi:MAG: AAA family ATPase [Desulfomonilaceae bacterium]